MDIFPFGKRPATKAEPLLPVELVNHEKDLERISLYDEPGDADDEEYHEAEKRLPLDSKMLATLRADPAAATLKGDYNGNSIYFYAAVKSIEEDRFFQVPTLIAVVCIIGQVLMLEGILFKNYVGEVPNTTTWMDMLKLPGLREEKLGFLAGLVISPMILLAKLMSNGEFTDIAVFAAMIKTYETSPQFRSGGSKASLKRWLIMGFWTVVHAVRSFFILPLFVFVNAKMMADVTSVMDVLTTNVGLTFLLDLDDTLFSALYHQDEKALDYCKKDMGLGTKLACTSFKNSIATVLFVCQLGGVIHFKFGDTLLDMWANPVVGFALLLTTLYEFPTSRYVVMTNVCSFLLVYGVWFYVNHCYIVPTSMGFLSPEQCNPYVDEFYFFPNVTVSTDTLTAKKSAFSWLA